MQEDKDIFCVSVLQSSADAALHHPQLTAALMNLTFLTRAPPRSYHHSHIMFLLGTAASQAAALVRMAVAAEIDIIIQLCRMLDDGFY